MDKFLTFQGLQPIWLGDFDFMQKAVGDVFINLIKGICGHDSIIISGCEVSVSESSPQVEWTDGLVALDGEILPIKAGSAYIPNPNPGVGFDILTRTLEEGERVFKDGQTHNCYQIREATIVAAATQWPYMVDFPRLALGRETIASITSDVSGVAMKASLICDNGILRVIGSFSTTSPVTGVVVSAVNVNLPKRCTTMLFPEETTKKDVYHPLASSSAINVAGERQYVTTLLVSATKTQNGMQLRMQIAPDERESEISIPSGIKTTFDICLNTI